MEEIIFKRKAYDKMLEWKRNSNGKTALLIEGARRVGKTSLEVKSSAYSSHPSLDAFCQKFSGRVSNRYLIYTKDLRRDGSTLLVPIYMTMFL